MPLFWHVLRKLASFTNWFEWSDSPKFWNFWKARILSCLSLRKRWESTQVWRDWCSSSYSSSSSSIYRLACLSFWVRWTQTQARGWGTHTITTWTGKTCLSCRSISSWRRHQRSAMVTCLQALQLSASTASLSCLLEWRPSLSYQVPLARSSATTTTHRPNSKRSYFT